VLSECEELLSEPESELVVLSECDEEDVVLLESLELDDDEVSRRRSLLSTNCSSFNTR
jgi:hypothetical protein